MEIQAPTFFAKVGQKILLIFGLGRLVSLIQVSEIIRIIFYDEGEKRGQKAEPKLAKEMNDFHFKNLTCLFITKNIPKFLLYLHMN